MPSTLTFYEDDFWSALFPMQTNLIAMRDANKEINSYLYQRILNEEHKGDNFLSQQRVYADKPARHLRRTVKLDPVAEYFIYDLTYRNRSIFRKPISDSRAAYGYRFSAGKSIPVSVAFKEFKSKVGEAAKAHNFHLSFDIASYFNTVYHHDLSHWFDSFDSVDANDKGAFGQFLREINSGRSLDVLPQGIYPTKMIGSEFLKFIDASGQIKSAVLLRFMDDFHLFDNDEALVRDDFSLIQKLLGIKALNINPLKTQARLSNVSTVVSEIRQTLFEIIEVEIEDYDVFGSGGTNTKIEFIEIEKNLTRKQVKNLIAVLQEEQLDENDAELVLNLLRYNSSHLHKLLPELWSKFPSLSKSLYSICGSMTDKARVAAVIVELLSGSDRLSEFQLFWIATLTEQHLRQTRKAGDLLTRLYELSAHSAIARAKVLEIPDQRFGLKEIREEHLKNGSSSWASWAAAMGSRTLKKAARNYVLDYFSKGSQMNNLIAVAARRQP